MCTQLVGKTKRRGGGKERGGEGERTTLVLSVHHPEPAVRVAAVKELGKTLAHKTKVCVVERE